MHFWDVKIAKRFLFHNTYICKMNYGMETLGIFYVLNQPAILNIFVS